MIGSAVEAAAWQVTVALAGKSVEAGTATDSGNTFEAGTTAEAAQQLRQVRVERGLTPTAFYSGRNSCSSSLLISTLNSSDMQDSAKNIF